MFHSTVSLSTETMVVDSRELPRVEKKQALAIFLLVLAVVTPFMHPRGEQQVSRYAATAAVWDLGSWEVTEYAMILQRDGAVIDGVVYTDKAPGQPLLAVPFYGVYRIVGGPPLSESTPLVDVGLWWLTVWSAGVPLAILAVLMYRWASEVEPLTALAATLTITFGSLLFVYGTLLFAHVVAGLLVFSMFLLVRRREVSSIQLVLAGVLGGAAVLVEYPMAVAVVIVTGAAAVVHRWRAWRVVGGGVPFVVALALYNATFFGSPITFSYQWNVFSGDITIRDEARGLAEIFAGLSAERVADVLFAERGLLIAAPVIALGVAGIYLMWKSRSRLDAVVALLVFFSMLGLQLVWPNPFAGGAGPRYVAPGLPFLAAPLALAWQRWRIVTTGLAVISIVTMTLATLTTPQMGEQFEAGLGFWVREILAGRTAPTVYTEWLGPWGWLVHAATIGAFLWLLKGLLFGSGATSSSRSDA